MINVRILALSCDFLSRCREGLTCAFSKCGTFSSAMDSLVLCTELMDAALVELVETKTRACAKPSFLCTPSHPSPYSQSQNPPHLYPAHTSLHLYSHSSPASLPTRHRLQCCGVGHRVRVVSNLTPALLLSPWQLAESNEALRA